MISCAVIGSAAADLQTRTRARQRGVGGIAPAVIAHGHTQPVIADPGYVVVGVVGIVDGTAASSHLAHQISATVSVGRCGGSRLGHRNQIAVAVVGVGLSFLPGQAQVVEKHRVGVPPKACHDHHSLHGFVRLLWHDGEGKILPVCALRAVLHGLEL